MKKQKTSLAEIKKLKKKILELENSWKRSQADFDNFRKRSEKEKINTIKFANKDLILELLPILDNFDRAIKNQPQIHESDKSYKFIKGVKPIKDQLEKALIDQGLEKIPAKPGDEFNPEIHEAIMAEESDKFDTDQIIEIIENGYKLNNEIIRPVKVKVAE